MLRDYEIELLEKMVQEEQYKNNIPLCTPFIKDFLEAYKKLKDCATPKKSVKKIIDTSHTLQGYYEKHYKTEYLCGNCKEKLISKNKSKFCHKCGQALDWSKEE